MRKMPVSQSQSLSVVLQRCAVVVAAGLVAACGGGSDSDATDPLAVPSGPSAGVPEAATASVEAYTRFAGRVIRDVGASPSALPLAMGAADAPASESASPLSVE